MDDLRLLEPQLQIGLVSSVTAGIVKVNLNRASLPAATVLKGGRYGLGEVGEFVLIEAEAYHLLGRITETRLPERERLSVEPQRGKEESLHPIGSVILLGTYDILVHRIRSGIQLYPRLGARVYSAPHKFLAQLPSLLDKPEDTPIRLHLGHIKSAMDTKVEITPERIFGRHCAILGTTGGGKSFTVARLLGECAKVNAKVILLDATGEYWKLKGKQTRLLGVHSSSHCREEEICGTSIDDMALADFMALFQPSGKVQGPKLLDAIYSLRYVEIFGNGDSQGNLPHGAYNQKFRDAFEDPEKRKRIESDQTPFDVHALARQIYHECTEYRSNKLQHDAYNFQFCHSLVGRIRTTINHPSLSALFRCYRYRKISDIANEFYHGEDRLWRISLEDVGYEFNAREILANLIGRWLLGQAREGKFKDKPVVVILDEAHQFLNKSFGFEDSVVHLDAFELIAKEGRKYGLNICLATQRPRDLPEGVLSQMGTLIVHRLTNDKDRDIVERACGEIDRSASAFLPNLQPGEAALIGVDFPIPMTIQFDRPTIEPQSAGPDYQSKWRLPKATLESPDSCGSP